MALVTYGDNDSYRTLTFGMTTPGVINYINNQWDRLSSIVTDNSFIERSKEAAKRYVSEESLMKAKQLLLNTGQMMIDPNAVYSITHLEGMQTATIGMQRYIMAHPEIRDLYQNQRIYGYADTYQDIYDNSFTPEEHPDYQRVMNNVIVINKDPESEIDWTASHYFNSLDTEEPLDTLDAFAVIDTWDTITAILKGSDEDPTNIFGGSRG